MTIECKNCSMHEQCICEASADECEIRKHEIFDTVTGKRIKRIL